ncbi:MAG: hypothetical protein IKV54_03900 [Clostridia bacterium]|nr:hypothetical protein [Clostridia bacterium]
MIHVGGLAIKTELFILICSLFVMLVQLLLCFKVRWLYLRIAPAVLLLAATVTLLCMAYTSEGWDGFGYLVIAIFTLSMLVFCGIGWVIWWVAGLIRNKNPGKNEKKR